MTEQFKIVIVGAGPAGLSAAGRAHELDIAYVLLESAPHLANTIYAYQKGKYVMAEPSVLPLRSPYEFAAGTRESILESWQQRSDQLDLNIRYRAEVTAIQGQQGQFTVSLQNGDQIAAENVVLSMGMQGNLRKLGAEGEDLPFVQYQLQDPDEFEDETIVIVGAGDSAIENALALAGQNNVYIVNRRDEFARAKERNVQLITKAIEDGVIDCFYSSSINRVEALVQASSNGEQGLLVLNTADGEATLEVHRIIARLGAIPPRKFLEACGIELPSADPSAVPAVDQYYQSNVAGLYVIGELSGAPLIKPSMNQGYEVIHAINGDPVAPVDEELLWDKLNQLVGVSNVKQALDLLQQGIAFLGSLTHMQMREFMLDSELIFPSPGTVIYQKNDYSDEFYSLFSGDVSLIANIDVPDQAMNLQPGEFFGEWSLISGRRRAETVTAGKNCVLLKTSRRAMRKLMLSVPDVQQEIDRIAVQRTLQHFLVPGVPPEMLEPYAQRSSIERFKPHDVIVHAGDAPDVFRLIRCGSAMVKRNLSGKDVVVSFLPVGSFIGEVPLLSEKPSRETVLATVNTETIRVDRDILIELMDQFPAVRSRLDMSVQETLRKEIQFANHPEAGDLVAFMMDQGIGEGTDVLMIDETLCVHCDNCETACADTHGGVSRLDREAGPSFAYLHIPTSCRHCEHPHCMTDCPPDAIHRATNGEVYIEDSCIGCGNCQSNCPYGVIQMGVVKENKTSLFSWLLFGKGNAPGSKDGDASQNDKANGSDKLAQESATPKIKKAVKCDMCKGLVGGAACVRACPTGAAIRLAPEKMVDLLRERNRRAS
ncbi:MAG TPA: cyclic nucleotide-binding domain-containing protein [Crenotrichaceae bacterium]|nr:cyclic nucleotide-binding domain-containing protein [Crenotrichaceae bacterium]